MISLFRIGVVCLAFLAAAEPSLAATFTVNSTANAPDSNPGNGVCATAGGVCTLRAAIQEANALAGTDTINFNIAGPGLKIIQPAAPLPTITGPVVLNAQTQPGWTGAPVVRLDGASAGINATGFSIGPGGGGTVIRGLMITRFTLDGIVVQAGANGVIVAGNWIGTDGSGSTTMGNTNDGIEIFGANATIGGTGANDRNVIVNNGNEGINVAGAAASGNVILGNYIGLEPDGTSGAGNGDVGIALLAGGGGNTIGGPTAAERNVISMNFEGIEISCPNNVVRGNFIGTDVNGTLNRGQRSDDGVEILAGGNGTVIGGTGPGEGNLIAFSRLHGVNISAGENIAVLGNRIHSNTLRGIDLGNNGVTPNDGAKTAGQPNRYMDFPVFTSATLSGTTLTVAGYVGSAPNQSTFANARVEVFKSDNDGSGYGEGQTYLGFLTSDANGNLSGAITVSALAAGDRITGTATDATNNTSEFGPNATVTTTVSGTMYEDVNYGGGAGRDRTSSSGVVRSGARVELYNNAGAYVTFTTTDGTGNYSFPGLVAGSYTVRVVDRSVTSSRTGYVAGLLPVLTYRTNASSGTAVGVTDYVGGQTPSAADAGNGVAGAVMNPATGVFTAGITGQAQSFSPVTISTGNVSGVDFGFNFDTVTNTNDTGRGSLRQFITNANTLGNGGLAIQGQTPGKEVSIFMIGNGQAHPGLRAGLPNLLSASGVAVITPATALPAISDADTTLDGTTQTTNVGNTNAVVLGSGGTVGVDGLALNKVAGPEVEIRGAGSLANGIQIRANNVTIRGLAINGFGTAAPQAGIRIDDTFTGTLIENNVLGSTATSFSDPGAGSRNWIGIDSEGGDSGTIRNNLIGFSQLAGIALNIASSNWTVSGNEIRDSGLATSDGDGITINASSTNTVTGNLITGSSSQGIVVTVAGATGNVFTNNTVTGNGVGIPSGLIQSTGITMRSGAASTVLDRNVVNANYGAGVQVNNGATGIRMTRNSFFANGTITARNGGAPTGQIGIDLNSPTDDINLGTVPFYTPNDSGDADTGGNGLLNFPILSTATVAGGNLILTGFALPGSTIELFLAESPADPSGFGEGKTYLATLVEGSAADTDATTGSYTNPVNGLNQGTDTTNIFSFSIPAPGGVAVGDRLTATATLGGSTSEFGGNVTVAASGYQPDAMIKLASEGAGAYATDNVYEATATTQVKSQGVVSASTAIYNVLFQNDGNVSDSVVITQAAADNCANYTIQYLDNTSTDRTAAVTGAGYTITGLAAGAGTTWTLRVTPAGTVNGGSPACRVSVTATSAGDGTKKDQVRAITTSTSANLTLLKNADRATVAPGQDITYTVNATNGAGLTPASVVVVADPIPAFTGFKVGSASFSPGTSTLSGAAVYSSDNGSTWTYTPVSGGCSAPAGYDFCVTNVRWTTSGTMPAGTSFTVNFAVRVK